MDHLARSQEKAIKLLLGVPPNSELSIARVEDQEVWLGFGWLVGKGWAAYRGDDCYAWRAKDESARPCACHPDDWPRRIPCQHKYAFKDCAIEAIRQNLAMIK